MEELQMLLIAIGMFVIGLVFGAIASEDHLRDLAGYQECISELPRNQDCKLIAVPMEENNQ